MNLATINHKLGNFSTELDNISKEGKVKTYTRDEAQRIGNRVEFLEQEISKLKVAKDELKWNSILK